MKPALRVVAPGLLTTVQDLGRYRYQHLGVPVCGALDPVSLRAANILAGNEPDQGALEIAYIGPALAIEADDVRMAVVGGEAAIEIIDDLTGRTRHMAGMRSFCVHRGETIRIGRLVGGAVLYLAVQGGFDIAPVMNSLSTCIRGGFGGWEGRALIAGDALPLRQGQADEREELRFDDLDLSTPARIRAIPGAQADHFSGRERAAFFDSEYTIGTGSDRMGMRLSGRPIAHLHGFDIVSDAIAPGSIQIPGNGQPIVLLADRQTTGGYPKIATVISADLPALSRLAVGGKISFESVTLDQAEVARRKHIADIAGLPSKLVPVPRLEAEVLPLLLACNLISGVVDAAAA
jgi:biotin-dependent carboxylase-like uncharacterized protein